MSGPLTLPLTDLFPYILVFTRLAGTFSNLPGFGESYISPRIRVLISFTLSLILTPVLGEYFPIMPENSILFMLYLLGEFAVGAFIGIMARALFAALDVAGTLIAHQVGLMNAMTVNPAGGGAQESLPSVFLSMLVLILIFATDTHHLILKAFAESYQLFQPGKFPSFSEMLSDLSGTLMNTMSLSFRLAIQIAAPLIITGTLIFIGAGFINRLLPQVMIIFIVQPFQIAIGFLVLMIALPAILTLFMENFQETIGTLWLPKAVEG